MDLVVKDVRRFDKLANDNNVPVMISSLVLNIIKDGQDRYGPR
jgi:3-hydroxyisobutyrate dehydrogenase